MPKHRQLLMNELANRLDESIFSASGPAAAAVTALHDVRPGEARSLRDALEDMESEQPLRQATGVHHLSCTLVRGESQLLFTAVIDTPGRQNLAEFLTDHIEVLDPVWRRCEGYPEQGIEDPAGIARFLSAGCEPSQLIYSGYPGATVKDVRKALDWMRKTMHFQIELAKSPRGGG